MNYTRYVIQGNCLEKTWIPESIICYGSNIRPIQNFQNKYYLEMKRKILGTLLAMKLDTEKNIEIKLGHLAPFF